jgi:hypothetical protein
MKRRKLTSLYGRLCLTVTAFALITGIITSPILTRIWSSTAVVAQR